MKRLFISALTLILLFPVYSQNFVSEKREAGSFPVVSGNTIIAISIDSSEDQLVQKAAGFLQHDVELVGGRKPVISTSFPTFSKNIIIIGTGQKSRIINILIREKKLNIDSLKGKWEAFQIQVVPFPFKGIDKALVIVGSDKRGTAYGVFELSKQMGVSPWYWWADVPVKKKLEVYVRRGIYQYGPPAVKYRGIFINDEAPAFSGWTKEKFGGVNHQVYEKVFELILRLKGNYLWPAMWGNAFYDDDSLNIKTADEYGVVMGTSHHEPLMRAHDEWRRYGAGKWNYDSNEVRLKKFWTTGMQRATNEKIISIGMRGDGDEPMSRETATQLLERIVHDQRQIIETVTGKPATETPQLWALYKEVQDYYDKGMRVPDDVTLLLCDDNWGNIRRLPRLDDQPRKGGYGIYYHFDYVGGPRNYKWLNTNPIPRVWEQMHLAYSYGVDRIWIVNVGDLKPMEFPISFFLDYAWNPVKIGADDLQQYTVNWCAAQFGSRFANPIADIISKYAKYNGRRKPELLDAHTYSIENYNEAQNVTRAYNELLVQAEKIERELPAEYRDAFFQLVLYPVKACANLQEMYATVALNHYAASKGWSDANILADKAKQLFVKDSLITLQYHHIAGGKWNHMMSQTHIGYTYWQQPATQHMPEVRYVPDYSVLQGGTRTEPAIKTAKKLIPQNIKGNAFYERDGYVSIEGAHYTRAINSENIHWKILPDLGKTASAVTAFPVTSGDQTPGGGAPHLQYEIYVYDTGNATIQAYFSPTLNIQNNDGLKYAVSIDSENPQIITINKDDNDVKTWEGWVANNIIVKNSFHPIHNPGKHVLNFWMVSPAVVLQKLVIDFGGLKPSYLGPPETNVKK